jgi:hypothetical protein
MDIKKEFEAYKKSIGDRVPLYKVIAEMYRIEKALYPGSHVDLMPSFVIPSVMYIDSYKGTVKFFKEMDQVMELVCEEKQYEIEPSIRFFEGDYGSDFQIDPVDLIISQYAGYVGQETKKYLKSGGILLANDSHGDATLAYCDPDFEFIAVVDSDYTIKTDHLDSYFEFARKRPIDLDKVKDTMKGPKYKIKAENYIFRKK